MKLVLFAEGPFGNAVGNYLLQHSIDVSVMPLLDDRAELESILSDSEFAFAALWRRYIRKCDLLDQVCHMLNVSWTSVSLEGCRLDSGPLIVPRQSGCFRCFRRRTLTHSSSLDYELALDNAYGLDSTLGSDGYTPSMVAIAAASLMLDWQERSQAAGRVRRLNILTGDLEETKLVRVHACDRCSQILGTARYTHHLVPYLKEILH